MHSNKSTKCPDCGKAISSINLATHIKGVHNKLKKTCNICNVEVPHFSISVHKRKFHNLGKSKDNVTPRGQNMNLKDGYQEIVFVDMELKEEEDDSKVLQL